MGDMPELSKVCLVLSPAKALLQLFTNPSCQIFSQIPLLKSLFSEPFPKPIEKTFSNPSSLSLPHCLLHTALLTSPPKSFHCSSMHTRPVTDHPDPNPRPPQVVASQNKISEIPASLLKVQSLATLDFADNALTAVPDGTGSLVSLTNLFVQVSQPIQRPPRAHANDHKRPQNVLCPRICCNGLSCLKCLLFSTYIL